MVKDHLTNDEDRFYRDEYPPLVPERKPLQQATTNVNFQNASKKRGTSALNTVWKMPAGNQSKSASTSRGVTPSTAPTTPASATAMQPLYYSAPKHLFFDHTITGCDVIGATVMQVSELVKAAYRKDRGGTLDLICGTQSITYQRAMICVHSPLVLQACVDDLGITASSTYELKDVQVPKNVLEAYRHWLEAGWIPDIAQTENNIATASYSLQAASIETQRITALKDLCALFKLGELLQDLRLMNTIVTALFNHHALFPAQALSRALTLARNLKRAAGSNNLISVLLYAQAVAETRKAEGEANAPRAPALLVDVEGSEICYSGVRSLAKRSPCEFHDHRNLFANIRVSAPATVDAPVSDRTDGLSRWSDEKVNTKLWW